MPKYFDSDELLKRLPDDLPYKASVKRVLIQAPEAEVVPKSEVEKIFEEIEKIIQDRKNKELKRQGDNKMISPYTYSLGALEIIECQFAELKKKYTEDNKE